MLKGGIVGLGKMGISHAAIVNSHTSVELVAICDKSSLVLDAFKRFSNIRVYNDFVKMIDSEDLNFIIIATPTSFHYKMVLYAIEKGLHVFCEKPFCLTIKEGEELVLLAERKNIINQVGYHNHFIGTFRELKRLIQIGLIGEIVHFTGDSYGPVVTKEKGKTWRSNPSEGGGCLYDYASHVINLIQEIIGQPTKVNGSQLKRIYSKDVEDAVYSIIILENGLSGVLSVNWSDETYRKMSTSLNIFGKNGKILCDSTEIKIYLKEKNIKEKLEKGWTIKYITDLTAPVNYYLRGEEYSAQIDNFFECILQEKQTYINSFRQALSTDKVIELIIKDSRNKG